MKKLLTLMLIASPITMFSVVGTNNFTVNIGGALNVSTIYGNANQLIPIKNKSTEYLGGGLNLELGHLYLSQGDNVIGADTRLGVALNKDPLHQVAGSPVDTSMDISFNTLSAYIGSTFIVGRKFNTGRLLFDIGGLDIGYFSGFQQMNGSNHEKFITYSGSHLLLSINLPLGTQYVFNNGLMLGFRHQLDMAFSGKIDNVIIEDYGSEVIVRPNKGGAFGSGRSKETLLSYSLTFSIGYAFGK